MSESATLRRLKPNALLNTLEPELLARALLDPRQETVEGDVAELLEILDASHTVDDFDALQREVFGLIYQLEEFRARCSRARKRVAEGKAPQEDAPTPAYGEPNDLAAWDMELFIATRLRRQLQAVGDGLAWRALRYDRAVVMALAANESAGPMYGKEGLPYELGRVEDIRTTTGRFGLLACITNCMRIGDVLEIAPPGADHMVHEVKSSGRQDARQVARIQEAIEAVMSEGPLPGSPTSQIFRATAPFATFHRQLEQACSLAEHRGCAALGIGDGRMFSAASAVAMVRRHESPEAAAAHLDLERANGLRRAHLDRERHLIRSFSNDTAARSPQLAPMAILPLPARTRAAMICDRLIVETVISVDYLCRVFEGKGFEILQTPDPTAPTLPEETFVLSKNGHRLTIHEGGLSRVLAEYVEPATWADGLAEVMSKVPSAESPELVFVNEARAWARHGARQLRRTR